MSVGSDADGGMERGLASIGQGWGHGSPSGTPLHINPHNVTYPVIRKLRKLGDTVFKLVLLSHLQVEISKERLRVLDNVGDMGVGKWNPSITSISHQSHLFHDQKLAKTRGHSIQSLSNVGSPSDDDIDGGFASIGKWNPLAYPAVVVDGEDVLLLRHHESEAPAGAVLEGDARGFRSQDTVDVVAVVELVVVAFGHRDLLRGVAVLHDDQVVGAQVRPPLLQKTQVADSRDHDVQLILQQRTARGGRHLGGVATTSSDPELRKRSVLRSENPRTTTNKRTQSQSCPLLPLKKIADFDITATPEKKMYKASVSIRDG